VLNKYVKPDFDLKANRIYSNDTQKADTMNSQALHDLKGINYLQTGYCGDFPEKIFPIEENLKLKIGAGDVCKKHINRQNYYFNGKMGVIKSLSSQEILVHFQKRTKRLSRKVRMAKHSIQGRSGD
jgi:hypothetical protein